MSPLAQQDHPLQSRLPAVRGRYLFGEPLAKYTWFKVGGPADVLFSPADEADLCAFLAALPDDIPVFPLGVGSNLLVRDGGLSGVVIRLGKAFGTITVQDQDIIAGAGATDVAVAAAGRDHGIGGLEFLRGVPGTIGGALKMNAGAYGREIADVFISARAVNRAGDVVDLSAADMGFSYRHTDVADDLIFISARLRGQPESRDVISQRMDAISQAREESQPLRTQTGGSTFQNPPAQKAWELVDAAGCRGLTIGGAQVSEKHCNFLINTGQATASDLEQLGEEVRRRVKEQSGVSLTWEIRIVGQDQDKTG